MYCVNALNVCGRSKAPVNNHLNVTKYNILPFVITEISHSSVEGRRPNGSQWELPYFSQSFEQGQLLIGEWKFDPGAQSHCALTNDIVSYRFLFQRDWTFQRIRDLYHSLTSHINLTYQREQHK